MTLTNCLITAYCSCHICCGPSTHNPKHLAANGRKPIQGITIAANRNIPLGTHIHINGMTNDFIVGDRYNKNLSDRIDIFFSSHLAAKQFGKQYHSVTVKKLP